MIMCQAPGDLRAVCFADNTQAALDQAELRSPKAVVLIYHSGTDALLHLVCTSIAGRQPHPLRQYPCAATCRQSRLRQRICANACVTVFGKAEKVTHSIHWRNSLSPQRVSPTPST